MCKAKGECGVKMVKVVLGSCFAQGLLCLFCIFSCKVPKATIGMLKLFIRRISFLLYLENGAILLVVKGVLQQT